MRIRHTGRQDKTELQMTPMIDIVFLLLVFFLMTFKIVLPEGDFSIRMPSASQTANLEPSETPTIFVRLRADAEGNLASVAIRDELGAYQSLGGTQQKAFAALRMRIRAAIGDAGGPDAAVSDQEVELDADYQLKYEYVMAAITHISGYIDYQTKTQHKLVERIRLAPLDD